MPQQRAAKQERLSAQLIPGTSGSSVSIAHQLNGGTGQGLGILPTMDETAAAAYASNMLGKGPVYGDRADANLIFGCKLLVLKGLAIHQRYDKVDTYFEAAYEGHPSGKTPTVEAYGARVDQLTAALGPDGFPVERPEPFTEEGA